MQNAVFIWEKKSTLYYKVLRYFLKCTAFVGSSYLLNISFVAFLYFSWSVVMDNNFEVIIVMPVPLVFRPRKIQICHTPHASFNSLTNSLEYLLGFV